MKNLLDKLHPQIMNSIHQGVNLGSELQKIEKSQTSHLPEATILFSARILEALSIEALNLAGIAWKQNTFINLERLRYYNLTPRDTLYWAHGIRRLGNRIRHVCQTPVIREEEEAVLAFLEHWLHWYFCEYTHGQMLPNLSKSQSSSLLFFESWLSRFMKEISNPSCDPVDISRKILNQNRGYEQINRVPTLMAVLAEKLIADNALEEATELLSYGLSIYPGYVLYQQLKGLALSRSDKLEEALDLLKPIHKKHKDLHELTGIMAGVYKRIWIRSNERKYLVMSNKEYSRGWNQDKYNSYLGINAATTTIFLGNVHESRSIAEKIIELLREKSNKLGIEFTDLGEYLGLWDQLTLAEANALLGNLDAAQTIYLRIQKTFPDSMGSIMVAKAQFKKILQYLESN